MAQPSVACYFNTRKRSAVEDHKVNRARKVLVLDQDSYTNNLESSDNSKDIVLQNNNNNKDVCFANESKIRLHENRETVIIPNKIVDNKFVKNYNNVAKKVVRSAKTKKIQEGSSQDIQQLFINMSQMEQIKESSESEQTIQLTESMNEKNFVTPPTTPTKFRNAMDKVNQNAPNLDEIKKKLSKSSRLAELKASISRFNKKSEKLHEAEEKTAKLTESLKLKTFKSIELEVNVSPQKVHTPKKAYLSPKKDTTARKNLLNLLSPTKNVVALPPSPSKQILEITSKPALTLPYKYRYLVEIFRAMDTVVQILFNRKETVTFRKLKPAVEDMLKRNLTLKHLAQIKCIYPDAYGYCQEKLRVFGTGIRQEQWELVLIPCLDNKDFMSSDILLNRRREMFNNLIEQVKHYHNEFLLTLDPPMKIPMNKITRWHPEFDIEKVPDIEQSDVPQPPVEEKLRTGKEVLERARQMFSCNTRMEQALERLKAAKESNPELVPDKPIEPTSILKGIPKALLEKVRQKQAAKALVSMTRSVDKEKEVQLYSRLPEIARVTRNLFVTEKKGVLALDIVVEKLGNSYRCSLTKTEMEEHLKVIAKEVPNWLIFHDIRHTVYLKLAKNADLSLVLSKLEKLAQQKSES